MKYVPNILTIVRFIFIPFIVVNIAFNNYITAVVLFTLSSITDVLDGFIARKFNAITDFGKLMDPLADKLTQLSILLTLVLKDVIPEWIFAILIIKELVMIAGASFLYGKNLVVSSKWYGKVTTVLIYVAIIISCLGKVYDLKSFDTYVYYAAVCFALFSLVMYFNYFYRQGYINKEQLKEATKVKNEKK